MSEDSAAHRRLGDAWTRTDRLFSLLAPAAWTERAIPLRHPPVFYLGHLPAFAWNQAGAGVLKHDPVDAELDELFERGIDPLDADSAKGEAREAWPQRARILAYRDSVRERLGTLDKAMGKSKDVLAGNDRIWHLIREHEEMHHETLLYLFQALEPRQLRRPRDWPRLRTGASTRAPRWIPVRSGRAAMGTSLSEVEFAWDNELEAHDVQVDAFELQDLPVTVGQYAAFVAEGGYRKRAWWTDAAWDWKKSLGLKHPQSWRKVGKELEVRSLFAWHPVDEVAAWPVLVSHAEAVAFATWSGARLPTEPELMRAAFVGRDDEVRRFPWGDRFDPKAANVDFVSGGLEPVGQRRSGQGPWGHLELLGNAWEWTDTVFGPFDGFDTWHHTYGGYSSDFFDEQHFVVFGASWATAKALCRRSFRNWYQGHYPYAFAGFRLARG
ncbi:MAG: SUMF1/EgtB/PvdO family nonheme iron enzyme [Myxococcota bacterium]